MVDGCITSESHTIMLIGIHNPNTRMRNRWLIKSTIRQATVDTVWWGQPTTGVHCTGEVGAGKFRLFRKEKQTLLNVYEHFVAFRPINRVVVDHSRHIASLQ